MIEDMEKIREECLKEKKLLKEDLHLDKYLITLTMAVTRKVSTKRKSFPSERERSTLLLDVLSSSM